MVLDVPSCCVWEDAEHPGSGAHGGSACSRDLAKGSQDPNPGCSDLTRSPGAPSTNFMFISLPSLSPGSPRPFLWLQPHLGPVAHVPTRVRLCLDPRGASRGSDPASRSTFPQDACILSTIHYTGVSLPYQCWRGARAQGGQREGSGRLPSPSISSPRRPSCGIMSPPCSELNSSLIVTIS